MALVLRKPAAAFLLVPRLHLPPETLVILPSKATPSNGEGPPVDGNGLRPTALVVGPIIANMAIVVAGLAIADRVAPVVGPVIAGLAVAPVQLINSVDVAPPVAGPIIGGMAVAPAQPINIANQHHQFAGGLAFDLEAGLLGSPPQKSNIGHHIHTKIPL